MQTKVIERYFFFGLLLATFVFAFFIFRPFWVVLVLSVAFSIVLYPIYEWLRKKNLPNWIASLLTVVLFAAIILGPISGLGILVFDQSQDVYKEVLSGENVDPFIDSMSRAINSLLPEGVTFDLREKVSDLTLLVSDNVAKIFRTTLSTFFSLVLIFLSIFYFLKDGARWRKTLIVFSPLPDTDDEKIIHRMGLAVNAVIKGYLFIAVVQGFLVGLGFWIFGVPHGALWGVVAAVTSLIPTFGTALVTVPAIIFLFMGGSTFLAVSLLIWAVAVVGMVDNFLSPVVIGTKVNISPFLILFSVLGGISLLGPAGILVGPLTLSFLYTLISIYKNEFKQNPAAQ
ncbi:AI-2E family transporter [Candidatus Nomurabacteria bacterium]|nr:AI-2E family transporter [Candidatus Nomurabacteria bacterium]